MGDHLKVDVGLIRSTGEGLGRIKDALQHADAGNPGHQVLGSDKLSDAMGDFVGNWKIHRRKLVEAVEAHQQMALASAEAYTHTDTELAKELAQSAGGAKAGGARAAS
ncbi:MAG: hypothetical protein ACRDRX_05755 [Pseudonocardiaceae bacterium]